MSAAQYPALTDEQITRIGETIGAKIPGYSDFQSWGLGYRVDESGLRTIPIVPANLIPFARSILAAQADAQAVPAPADLIPPDALFVCGQMGANVTRVRTESAAPAVPDGSRDLLERLSVAPVVPTDDRRAAFEAHMDRTAPAYWRTTEHGRDSWRTWQAALSAAPVVPLTDERIAMLEEALRIVRQHPDFDDGGPMADMMDNVLAGKGHPMLDFLAKIGGITPGSAHG